MDKIKIQNLEVYGNHGVFPEETKLGQKFLISCILYLDTRKAGKKDALDLSVHYGLVSHMIKKEMEEHTFALIETVAEHLAESILLFDEKIREVEVEVKKPWAPIGLPLDYVSVSVRRKWHEAYVALGSNMGDRTQYLLDAVEKLQNRSDCRVQKVSSLLETEPYGVTQQEKFMNAVLKMDTLLMPEELLEVLQQIELEANRVRTLRWGPRTLDLDILFYDDEIIEEDHLCVPHIDMANRLFVLQPLEEIAPYKRHPITGKTVKEMIVDLKKETIYNE